MFTVSSGPDADHGVLGAIAAKSGGEHLDLGAGVDKVLARLIRPAPRPIAVSDADGKEIAFTLLPAGANAFRLIGRVPSSGQVSVELSGGEGRDYDVARAPVIDNDAAGALWAAAEAAQLSATDRPDADRILAFTRRYSVAAEGSAFIVLETAQDYVDAGIEPPPSLGPDTLADYRKLLDERNAQKKRDASTRLDTVVKEWAEEKAWYAKTFNPHPAAKKKMSPGAPTIQPRVAAPPPVPMAAPAAAAPAADANYANSGQTVQEVVVTGSRAPHPGLTSVSPTTTVGSQDVRLQGVQNVEDLVNGLPQAFAGAAAIDVETAPWNPKRPYLAALDAAPKDDFQRVYREQEAKFGNLPAFYLDVAEWLFRKGRAAEAQAVALNALDVPSADDATATILADRLMRYGDEAHAMWLYERLTWLEPDRPQPWRNLALALVDRADRTGETAESRDAKKRDYARALGLLNDVVLREWSSDYEGFELVVLEEANRVIPRYRTLGGDDPVLDPRLIAALDVDLRVTLEWNVDATDMDLWVDEPDGERAIYDHPRTAIGGRLSHDMTQGYGPEEYLLRRAPAGTYTVRVNIFRTDALNPNGPITVRARLWRHYGRPNEQQQTMDLELKPGEDGARVVGTLKVAG